MSNMVRLVSQCLANSLAAPHEVPALSHSGGRGGAGNAEHVPHHHVSLEKPHQAEPSGADKVSGFFSKLFGGKK